MLFSELVSDCFELLDHGTDLGRKVAMAQIGQPIRRYTVIPLQEPVSPTPERIAPPPPIKSPAEPMPNLVFITPHRDQNELANSLKHEGIRVEEIIAYRAWRVVEPSWSRTGDDRLHSVFVKDYVWPPDEPASGDVKTHGIYSFQDVICAREEYGYSPLGSGQLLFGKVKIWGEIVEHEAGYRSQFGKIVSLDHGDPELLMKFCEIYRLNMSSFESSRIGETFQ